MWPDEQNGQMVALCWPYEAYKHYVFCVGPIYCEPTMWFKLCYPIFLTPFFFHPNFPTANIEVLKTVIKFCIECRWLYVFHKDSVYTWVTEWKFSTIISPQHVASKLLWFESPCNIPSGSSKKTKQPSASEYQGYVKGNLRGH